MMLTSHQVRQYEEEGAVAPYRVLSESGASRMRLNYEAAERDSNLPPDWSDNPHLLFEWASELVRNPRLLDAVEALIGPDILCWEVDTFLKEAGTQSFVSWHQDVTYWGLEADKVVTAWVALTSSNRSSGCLAVIPGSHTKLLAHEDSYGADNMLSRGQTVAVDIGTTSARHLELLPGECSFHHVQIVHSSGPNESANRRLGLAIRYMATSVSPTHSMGDYATLVRGLDSYGHFSPAPLASGLLDNLEMHRRINEHRTMLTMPSLKQSSNNAELATGADMSSTVARLKAESNSTL